MNERLEHLLFEVQCGDPGARSAALASIAAVLGIEAMSQESYRANRSQYLQYLPAEIVDLRISQGDVQAVVERLAAVCATRSGISELLWVIGKARSEAALPALVEIVERRWKSFSEEELWQALCALEVGIANLSRERKSIIGRHLEAFLVGCHSFASERLLTVARRVADLFAD